MDREELGNATGPQGCSPVEPVRTIGTLRLFAPIAIRKQLECRPQSKGPAVIVPFDGGAP